jgi:hypothetical protein
MSDLPPVAADERTWREVSNVPTRDIPRSPRGRAPCKRGAPGANSQALIESTRFTPWRVIESLDEKVEKRICDADLAGSKFLIR